MSKYEEEVNIDALRESLGITEGWRLQNMKETALNRCRVKRSRRKHCEKVINEFIALLKESQ